MFKIKYIIFCLLFLISCVPTQHNTQAKPLNVDNILNTVQGVYTGVHKGVEFEVWVESIGESNIDSLHKLSNQLIISIFAKHNLSIVTNYINTYPNNLSLDKSNICHHVSQQDTSGAHLSNLYAREIWKWYDDPRLGGIGRFQLQQKSTLIVKTIEYIDLHNNDEYGFSSIDLNSAGEIIKINFFETGFIKKPWNYFLSSSIKIKKTSSKVKGYLIKYFDTLKKVDNLIVQAQCFK